MVEQTPLVTEGGGTLKIGYITLTVKCTITTVAEG